MSFGCKPPKYDPLCQAMWKERFEVLQEPSFGAECPSGKNAALYCLMLKVKPTCRMNHLGRSSHFQGEIAYAAKGCCTACLNVAEGNEDRAVVVGEVVGGDDGVRVLGIERLDRLN